MATIQRELRKIIQARAHLSDPIQVIHGAARGADTIGGKVAKEMKLSVEAIPANWGLYGKAAGHIRNKWMLDRKPDLVLAFHPDIESSKGTKHMVKIAREAGVEVRVFKE